MIGIIFVICIFSIFFIPILVLMAVIKLNKYFTQPYVKSFEKTFSKIKLFDNKISGEYKSYNFSLTLSQDKILYLKHQKNKKFNFRLESFHTDYSNSQVFTGDEYFDQKYFINSGDLKRSIGLLSIEVRNLIDFISFSSQIIINNNTIKLFSNNHNPDYWKDNIIKTVKLAECLLTDEETDKLLMNNILNDSNYKVKINNFNELTGKLKYIKNDKKQLNKYYSFFYKMLDSKDPVNILLAAGILEEESIPELIKLLYLDWDYIFDSAFKILKNHLNKKNVRIAFYRLLRENKIKRISKILNLFIDKKDNKSVKEVSNYIYNRRKNIDSYPSIKIMIIKYIGELKVTEFYEWILKNLFNRNNQIKIECIKVLKKFGKVNSVESLLRLTKKINISSIVKKEAIDAVKHIQKNIPENNRGDLTIAEIEEIGKLSNNNEEFSKIRGNLSHE